MADPHLFPRVSLTTRSTVARLFGKARESGDSFTVLSACIEDKDGHAEPVALARDLGPLAEDAFGHDRVVTFEAESGLMLGVTGAGDRFLELAHTLFDRARDLGRLSVGVAHNTHVEDGLSLTALTKVAREGERVAVDAGGNQVCHSELYDLYRAVPDPPLDEEELEVTVEFEELEKLDEFDTPADAQLPERILGPRALVPETSEPCEAFEAKDDEEEDAQDEYVHEIELLERRLRNVTRELERAQAELAQFRRRQSREETGVASAYRGAQGLSSLEPDYEHKIELLKAIYQANMEMKNALRSRAL